jgi:hypothetical protein
LFFLSSQAFIPTPITGNSPELGGSVGVDCPVSLKHLNTIHFYIKTVPFHAMVALGGRGNIAPTHS